MFAFESLKVYENVKTFNSRIFDLIEESSLRPYVKDQLGRASLSIRLNIAEGSSRSSNRDKRRFMEIARGSAFECISLLEYLKEKNVISNKEYSDYYLTLEEISKMLFGIIKKLE